MINLYSHYVSPFVRNKTFRDGSLFTAFSFFNSGMAFFLLIVIAKYLDPSGYGKINLFNTLVTIIGFIVCLNSYGVISINYFNHDPKVFYKSIRAVSDITILLSIIISGIILMFYGQIEVWTGLSLKHQIIALIISSCGVYNNIVLNIWRVKEQIASYGFFSCFFAFSNFILTLYLVASLKQGWEGRINALLVISIIFCVICLVVLYKNNYCSYKPDQDSLKDCISFGIPLIPHSISSWLRQGLDRVFLNTYQSVNVVGLFSFSYNFANLLMIIGTAFNSANSVFIYKNLSIGEEHVRKKLRKQTWLVISFFLFLTIGVCIASPLFINLFFPSYKDCSSFLIFQCFTAFFHCVYLQFVNFLFYFKKTKELMYITFSVSLFHMICSLFLSRVSVYLTLWVGLVSSFLIAFLVFLYSRKVYKII